jgi:hypothetical protein
MAFHFLSDLIRAADVLVLDVENRIDEMLALQDAKAVFEAEAGKDGGIAESGLAIEVELAGPPGGGAVLELHPEGVEVIAGALRAKGGEVFDFEVAGLFEIVVIGDDVRAFLGKGRPREENEKKRCQEKCERRAHHRSGHRISLQIICNCKEI